MRSAREEFDSAKPQVRRKCHGGWSNKKKPPNIMNGQCISSGGSDFNCFSPWKKKKKSQTFPSSRNCKILKKVNKSITNGAPKGKYVGRQLGRWAGCIDIYICVCLLWNGPIQSRSEIVRLSTTSRSPWKETVQMGLSFYESFRHLFKYLARLGHPVTRCGAHYRRIYALWSECLVN